MGKLILKKCGRIGKGKLISDSMKEVFGWEGKGG